MSLSASISPELEKVIFTEQYWKRPKQSPKGDDSQEPIYKAVGHALSNWEEADQALADLFLIFTCNASKGQPPEQVRNAVRRAYGSIISNSGRRLAVEAAAEVYFSPWEDFKKQIRKSLMEVLNVVQWASRLRDDIAHGIVWPFMTVEVRDSEARTTKTERLGCFLMPPEYKTDRTHAYPRGGGHPTEMLKAEYCFTSKNIEQIAFNFIAVRAVIQRYEGDVTKNRRGEMPLITKLKRDAEAKAEKKK
jgi:hypothetical protein